MRQRLVSLWAMVALVWVIGAGAAGSLITFDDIARTERERDAIAASLARSLPEGARVAFHPDYMNAQIEVNRARESLASVALIAILPPIVVLFVGAAMLRSPSRRRPT
jgi:hypothetical protein